MVENTSVDRIIQGDCIDVLRSLPDQILNTVVTSPPYYCLRDYGIEGQFGLEQTPEEYTQKLVELFREVRRVLKDDGTVWLNLGDSYNGTKKGNTESNKAPNVVTDTFEKKLCKGLKPKDLIGIPWRVAFALQADGWYLRQDIIWHKPNPMPESVTDRCTKSHEYIFLLSKSQKYYYDNESIKEESKWAGDSRAGYGRLHYRGKREGEKGTGQENFVSITEKRNKRDVWEIPVKPFSGAHFATFPEELIYPCILAGCQEGGLVYDPFMGAGTTALVAKKLARHYLGSELNPEYIKIAEKRLSNVEESLFL